MRITMESFGSECPMNWEEIANYLNDKIDELENTIEDEDELNEALDQLWEDYCNGDMPDAPVASDEPWRDAPTVINEYGVQIDYEAAVNLMDDELREEIHMDIAPCTEQEFFDEYARRHEQKFGEPWELAKPNPVF